MKRIAFVVALLGMIGVMGCSEKITVDSTLDQSVKVFDEKGNLVSCQMVHSGDVRSYPTGMIHVIGYGDSTRMEASYEAQFPNTYKAIVSNDRCDDKDPAGLVHKK